jgi:D-serine deaminase-like pyridoxal phosphate-dependent protein
LYVLTTGSTCSASESLINGLRGVGVQVHVIGNTTCGKPYGMAREDNCGSAFYPVEFRGENNLGQANFTNGFAPTCTVADDFSGIGEIRPGNFIYYDMKMVQISACEPHRISVCMVAPVISIHPERNEVILHGGSVHFSKDSMTDADGKTSFGQVVRLTETGWGNVVDGATLRSLCQEHGFVTGPSDFIQSLNIGDLVGVLPVHSCLTADCMGEVHTLDGERLVMMR